MTIVEIFGRFQTEPLPLIESRLFGDFDAGESRVVPADQQCMTGSVVRVNNGSSRLSGRSGQTGSTSVEVYQENGYRYYVSEDTP